jgi:acyl-CoA synthetase (AMP-forming)/AMP-acid ligase II
VTGPTPPGSFVGGATGNSVPASDGWPDEDPRGDLRWGTIPRLVEDAARRFGEAPAIVDGDEALSFGGLAAAARSVTRAAIASGVRPGDRVAIWAPNSLRWAVAGLGLVGAGAMLVPINTRLTGTEAADILRRARVVALCTVRGFLGTDYPASLTGASLPDLDRIVLLTGEGAGDVTTAGSDVPVYGFDEWLAGADGVVEAPGERVGEVVDDEAARERWEAVQPEDIADISFTSGTTGTPKGVPASHGQSVRAFGTWAAIAGLRAGDRYAVVNPFSHTFGWKAGVLASLMAGATIYPVAVLDPDRLLGLVAAERITVLPGPPTLYQTLLQHSGRRRTDLSSLRLAVTGAAVVPVDLVRALRDDLGLETVLTAYGLTESTGMVAMCRRGDPPDVVARTSGRAIPGVEVRIAPLGSEPAGEILVRGYTVMAGYLDDPDATAAAVDADGWLHTGDIGLLDVDGNVTITDRLKDMFVVGGFNAYPAEIERRLLEHPDVAEAAVVAMPDDRLGEVGCAFVVPTPGAATAGLEAALIEHAQSALANYKVPRRVVLVDELPLTGAGKVHKAELRRRAAADAAPSGR